MCVFRLLFLVAFAVAVRHYGMEGIYVVRGDTPLVAAWGLCPFDYRRSAHLFLLFCFLSWVSQWRVFHIVAREVARCCARLCIVYRFASGADYVRCARIDVARLVFVVVLRVVPRGSFV